MSAIKKEEVMTPLRGLCDTVVKGEGIIDLTGPREGAPEAGNYIALSIDLQDEGIAGEPSRTYAEVSFTNNYESLIEDGVPPEVAGYIVASADLFAKALKALVFRGGKYGGTKDTP